MKYTGTVKEVLAVEDAIIATGNFTRIKDGRRPDPNAQYQKHSAYSALYEVYLDKEAAQYAIDPDKWFYLVSYPHVLIRIAGFARDDTGEVKVSPRKLPNLLSIYPKIAEALSPLQYKDNPQVIFAKT